MYSQEDWEDASRQLKQRWIWVSIPVALLLVATIASYVIFHNARNESGWIWTSLLTILCGSAFIFLYGVLLRPVILYRRHLALMLRGRMRETTGILNTVDEQVKDKDGIGCISFTVNIGEKNDPEDDRLFYFDVQKGALPAALGARVTVRSNDRMVSDLRLAA